MVEMAAGASLDFLREETKSWDTCVVLMEEEGARNWEDWAEGHLLSRDNDNIHI